ncbi:unnamed protein product [Lactuca virosa]|uniref:Uncharacterized protein n=1 Tax=Lactuca virosa TaxID=75947 RepID=A0AAU9NY86_9ASTR|nr:unnamed protein product [Lactuca virosa]
MTQESSRDFNKPNSIRFNDFKMLNRNEGASRSPVAVFLRRSIRKLSICSERDVCWVWGSAKQVTPIPILFKP